MGISDISKKAYDGVSKILKDNGQPFSKGQAYAVECLVRTIEESTEKRCLDITKSIISKKNQIINNQVSEASKVSEDTLKQVNEMVEQRVQELKKEIPEVLDYAKMKKLQDCIETIKESVGYASDEQVSKVASESAKMLNTTRGLIETQAKTISEKTASLGESAKTISQLREQVKQMQVKIDEKDKQIVESVNKAKELVASNQNLQKKVEESKKLTESIEQKRKSESLKYYLESKIAQYPKYEAALLRKHFANAKSQAEIDENFSRVLAEVGETRDAMRNVQKIQVAPVKKQVNEDANKKISGETIVTEDGGNESNANASQMIDESFVDIDNDVISNEEMQRIISWL